jgi:hypothetical protein
MTMKSWGNLTKQPGTEYQQVSSGESHAGAPGGKFVPGTPKGEYRTNTSGESHPSVKTGPFIGHTKGNKDLPPDHTSRTPHGNYKGK